MIQRGELKPGDHLGTIELAERFGVSRGPIREALRLLESRLLVRVLAQKGAFVMALRDDEALEAMETREVLFGGLAEHAARRAKRAHLDALARSLTDLRRLAEDPATTPHAFQMGTYAYIAHLYEAAGNQRLVRSIRDLSQGVGDAYGHLSMATQEMRRTEYAAYAVLTAAVTAGDAQAAFQAAREMHADGVRRARELQALMPQPATPVEFKGRRRRSRRAAPQLKS